MSKVSLLMFQFSFMFFHSLPCMGASRFTAVEGKCDDGNVHIKRCGSSSDRFGLGAQQRLFGP